MFHLDTLSTLVAATLVLLLGRQLVQNVPFLKKYTIPEPVAGGLLVALALLVLKKSMGTLYKINMLLLGERHQLQPNFIAQHTHNLCREYVLLLPALEQQFHLLPFEHFRLAVNLDA